MTVINSIENLYIRCNHSPKSMMRSIQLLLILSFTIFYSQSKKFLFQDGPYKFFGLPGLILEIEEDTNSL